ncbi:MAG: HlyD family efflux transporter periplasmic adaptor subunit [Lachnospiraceae bacterium]|nr:HlyD family efflux transporter periplasmic adaptor subunit [Lachnospiraceae bacterium]
MKPIIVDMKDMSDSREVYDSKPMPVLVYTIYCIALLFIMALIWACLFKLDIVIKSDGLFQNNESIYEISSGVTGKVIKCQAENGTFVTEGEVLYELDIDSLSESISNYVKDLKDVESRIEILKAYEESLSERTKVLDKYADNPYYKEFVNRRELLYANIEANADNTESQTKLYQGNVDNTSATIEKYKAKITKLAAVKQCITSRSNTFGSEESYYYSMVNSYISNYNYTALGYDNKIAEYQAQVDSYNEQITMAERQNVDTKEPLIEEAANTLTSAATIDVDTLKKQRDTLNQSIEAAKNEKTQALNELELQEIATIEQQIESLNNTVLSLESNLTSEQLQLESAKASGNSNTKEISILTEKGNIATELLNYQEKKQEDENYLKSYDIQNNNCSIKASTSGYFYESELLKVGSYVQEGTALGKIYPDRNAKYYASVYVENSDIAKIKENQEVKFEIAAYPSNEYGYFIGVVESIPKDITIDQSTGQAYYIVKVACDELTLKGKNNEEASLKNGMACQAKIIVEQKSVLNFLLEKINIID